MRATFLCNSRNIVLIGCLPCLVKRYQAREGCHARIMFRSRRRAAPRASVPIVPIVPAVPPGPMMRQIVISASWLSLCSHFPPSAPNLQGRFPPVLANSRHFSPQGIQKSHTETLLVSVTMRRRYDMLKGSKQATVPTKERKSDG